MMFYYKGNVYQVADLDMSGFDEMFFRRKGKNFKKKEG